MAPLMVFVMLDGSFFWMLVGPMCRFLDVGWSDGSFFLDLAWSDGSLFRCYMVRWVAF